MKHSATIVWQNNEDSDQKNKAIDLLSEKRDFPSNFTLLSISLYDKIKLKFLSLS